MSQNEPSGSQRPQPRACNQCQKRKSKCTGENPCAFCAKTKRECIYEARPIRTPLTRKNLDAAEHRCEQLTSLLKTLSPGINIDAALQGQLSHESPPQSSPPQPESSLSPPSQNVEGVSPDSSNDFEWHEEPLSGKDDQVHALRDGMALLSTNPSASGYIGSSAGSSMLQTISSLLSLSGRGPLDDPSRKQLTELIARRQRSDSGTLLREEYLGSSMVIDGLVDAYFMLYNTSYPILHRQIFRESYNRRDQIPNSSTWHIIFYIVLAIGHWTLSAGDNQDDSPYYLEARSRLSTGMLESGTLVGVQIFLLMGNYIQKRDRPNTGYNMIGIAFRMALGLGLHREITATNEVRNTLGIEMRRRIWWILYMFDSGFSITMGRPTTASDSFIDVRLPQNVDDLHMMSQDISSPLPSPVSFPTTYSAMIAQARLAVIANRIYNEFLASHISNAAISEELATIFEGQLRAWRDSLPPYFTAPNPPDWFAGPRASILWKEQNLRMMLWRGGQRSSKTPSENQVAVRNCLHVAIETVQSISTFCMGNDNLHQGISWYATYFLFQAVLVLDVRLLQAPQDNFAVIWRGSVEQARTCLSQLGTTNAAALRCIFVLDRIHNHHVGSSHPQPSGEGFTPNPLEIGVPDHTSGYTNEQTYLADPALQFFLDDPHVPNLFDGMSGFPSTQEQQNFHYVLGDFYANEDMDTTMTWPETQF